MKKQIRLLLRFAGLFGTGPGYRLWRQVRARKLENIRIPNARFPIALRERTSDLATFYQVFVNNEYRIEFPQNPKVIIDGGANVGMFSVYVKNKYPQAMLIAVEPDRTNFEVLAKNMANYENVHCENAGLWSKDTGLRIHDKYQMGKWAMVVEETTDRPDLQAISLSTLFSKYGLERVDILKLDIETSEKAVFSEGFEEWLPKVKMLVVELHDWMEPGCAKPFFEAVNKCFGNYKYSMKGENTIITNLDLE